MRSGNTLWDELCLTYQQGVDEVGELREKWASLEGEIDELRHHHVSVLLKRQEEDAKHWRDAILSYFQTFSQRPLPEGVEPPAHDLQYYKDYRLYHVPGYPGDLPVIGDAFALDQERLALLEPDLLLLDEHSLLRLCLGALPRRCRVRLRGGRLLGDLRVA